MKWCYSYIMYKSVIFRLVISLNREIPNKLGKTLWGIPDQVGNDVAETISSYRKRFLAALSSALNDGIRCIVLSNREIASSSRVFGTPRNDCKYEDLLKWN